MHAGGNRFDARQQYQLDAIRAVVDLFTGQPPAAGTFEWQPEIFGGDLLDLGSALDFDVQIMVVEKYLGRIRQKARLLVSSGNHDGDSRSAADESVAQWIRECKADGFFVDGDSLELPGALVTICPWWDGPTSRAELEAQLEREARRVRGRWIWVHHSPPAGSPVCWTGRKFGGDECLLEWIHRFAPAFGLDRQRRLPRTWRAGRQRAPPVLVMGEVAGLCDG